MSNILQYVVIFALFIIAVYLMLRPVFSKKKSGLGCGKGCNCSASSIADMPAGEQKQ